MFDIVTIGSATKDIFLFTKQASLKQGVKSHFLELPFDRKLEIHDKLEFTGGSATNTAATFANFGKRVAVISKIGNDSNADFILNDLNTRKISSDYLIKGDGDTPFSTILVSNMNKAVILVYRGIENSLKFDEIDRNFDTEWILVGPLTGNSLNLLKGIADFCYDNKINLVLNPGSNELNLGIKKLNHILKNVRILSMNNTEAMRFVGFKNDIRNLLELKKVSDIAIITKGSAGSIVADDHYIYSINALPVKQINYIGAGDAYLSAFTNAIMDGKDIEEAINLAVNNSASVVQHFGAKDGLLKNYPEFNVKIKKVAYKKS